MAYTWGNITLTVAKNSYKPPIATSGISELQILPDSSGNAASVLQQSGRGRKRAYLEAHAAESVYKSIESDYYNATTRTFTDIDGNTLEAIIETFAATREAETLPYKCSIGFLEV